MASRKSAQAADAPNASAKGALAMPVLDHDKSVDKPDKPAQAAPVAAAKQAEPVFGDRVIRLSLCPTRGHDGTVIRMLKDFPKAPWSEQVFEDWGMMIDEGHREHPIAAITLNLVKSRQEVNLQPLNIEDMPAAIDKYTALGWVIEDGPIGKAG